VAELTERGTRSELTFDACSIRQPVRNRYHVLLRQILDDMQNETSAWPFLKPVDSNLVKDYYGTIKEPMGECSNTSRRGALG
jgi:hypothetical protein